MGVTLATLLQEPVTVRIVEPHRDPTGLADLLIRSLGLTGVLALVALLAGVVLAVVLFTIRSRSS